MQSTRILRSALHSRHLRQHPSHLICSGAHVLPTLCLAPIKDDVIDRPGHMVYLLVVPARKEPGWCETLQDVDVSPMKVNVHRRSSARADTSPFICCARRKGKQAAACASTAKYKKAVLKESSAQGYAPVQEVHEGPLEHVQAQLVQNK